MVISPWIRKQALYQPDKVAIIFGDQKISYREFNRTINRIAHYFASIGIGKGDRVAVLMHNHPCMLETYFACAKSGAIFVPFNFRLTMEELKYQISDCTPKLTIFSEDVREMVDEIQKEMKVGLPQLAMVNMTNTDSTDYIDFYKQIYHYPDKEIECDIVPEDCHMIMYSSGTTGYPKGIVMPHRKAFWNTINAVHSLDLSRKDISLCVLPFFHSGGLNVVTIPTLYQGGTVVILSKFDVELVLKTIEDIGCTNIVGVPTIYECLLDEIEKNTWNLSSLRFLLCGGAPLSVGVIEAYKNHSLRLMQVFGGTETSICTCLKPEDAFAHIGSSGQPLMHVEVLVVDENGNKVKQGEVGEAVTKGPTVMTGFWNDPEDTKKVLKGDEFHTGDLVVMEEGDYLKVVGRKKDMIISGGENIYPAEIERVLSLNPKIKEAVVVGCKNDKWGEVGVAVVVLKDNQQMTLEDLTQFCGKNLAKYKIPKHLKIIKELPRTPTGKVRKEALLEMVENIW